MLKFSDSDQQIDSTNLPNSFGKPADFQVHRKRRNSPKINKNDNYPIFQPSNTSPCIESVGKFPKELSNFTGPPKPNLLIHFYSHEASHLLSNAIIFIFTPVIVGDK